MVVSDVYGDGRHVSIDVISNAFEGEREGGRAVDEMKSAGV